MKKILSITLFIFFCGLMVSCNSDHTAGNPSDTEVPEIFAADENNSGDISLRVLNPNLNVGDSSRFSAELRSFDGTPVPNTPVLCTAERGLTITDPISEESAEPIVDIETGEIADAPAVLSAIGNTDPFGNMSGSVECTHPGSFNFTCSLPNSGRVSDTKVVKCGGSKSTVTVNSKNGLTQKVLIKSLSFEAEKEICSIQDLEGAKLSVNIENSLSHDLTLDYFVYGSFEELASANIISNNFIVSAKNLTKVDLTYINSQDIENIKESSDNGYWLNLEVNLYNQNGAQFSLSNYSLIEFSKDCN